MELILQELKKDILEIKELFDMKDREVFNTKQAANYLSISTDSLLRYRRIGDIKYFKNGTSYLFRKKHLDDWLDKMERRYRNG